MPSTQKLKPVFFRLPDNLAEGLRVAAARRGEATAVVLREIIREGLERRGILPAVFGSYRP